MITEQNKMLFSEMEKLNAKYELSSQITPEYFEPGMMEYLDKYYGVFDSSSDKMTLRFASKGTRYEGRTEIIERIKVDSPVTLVRDPDNKFNSNNFIILDQRNRDIGNVPATICNALAPLVDAGLATIDCAKVSFVDPVTKRNRHAKQGELFIEVVISV